MSWIGGESGSLTINDSCIRFENWNIKDNISDWSGSFKIQELDFKKLFAVYKSDQDQQIMAEFHKGIPKYGGKITIDGFQIDIPGFYIVRFSGINGLNKEKIR